VRSFTHVVMEKYQSLSVSFQVRIDSRGKKDKNTQGIDCHECYGFGHIRAKYSNYKKSKRKAMKVTLGMS
jgi:hypothetical protein